jgi:hypothetical protein
VNSDDYGGRLLLLPGSIHLPKFSFDLERNEQTSTASRYWGAVRRALLGMAMAVQASFVLLDLGPHTDTLHKCLITSCDAIQPVVGACSYSCMSTYRLVHSEWGCGGVLGANDAVWVRVGWEAALRKGVGKLQREGFGGRCGPGVRVEWLACRRRRQAGRQLGRQPRSSIVPRAACAARHSPSF